jgi:chromosomal replication initiator protein
VTISDRDLLANLTETIAERVGQARYTLWFAAHTKFRIDTGHLTVAVPNRHFEEWLQKTFGVTLSDAAREVFGGPVEVRYAIEPHLFREHGAAQAELRQGKTPLPESLPAPAPAPAEAATAEPATAEPAQPAAVEPDPVPAARRGAPAVKRSPPAADRARRWHKLSEFVVGPCNRVAFAAAMSTIEEPGEGVNPLVLHGPVGTGKTHLLEGIYSGLRRARPDWRVLYVTTEDFTNRFVGAMRLNKLGSFRKHFRECDALLVDDLHFLATKRATAEEFLHTFDALLADGRQMVLTTDCHPRLADDFTAELTDRLLGGAVWGLTPPDPETRLNILRAKAHKEGGPAVPEEVLRFLAGKLRGNVRELEGALHSVRHYSRVTGRPVDLGLVREALAELLRHAVRVVQVGDVERVVCDVLKLDAAAMRSKARAWAISHPRMLAMYLARKHTASAYSEIGGHFGGRMHSTVVAAEKKVRQWLQDDAELSLGERRVKVRELVERVERDLLR